ncbi:dynein axonemal heavy chain 7-like isoform X4 [Tachypleus tridentatus]|uniref:dynein axonemal heavy chain 7-like isoform X4 n=1 Tax=Tachypleus tridentatus TaxID=6853 RepID=UPI003FCF5367
MWRWFTAVQNTIHQGIKQKHVPSPTIQLHLQSFFDNVAMLMTLQLQSLCKVFMEKYTEFLCRSKENHMFIIKLVAVGQQIKLEPTYHDFETVLLDILDSLLHSVRIIPRVENHLNTSESSFEVWRKQVYEYKSWINKFMYTADKIVDLGMFQLDFRELYESLASQTEILLEKLLNNISNEHQEESKRMVAERNKFAEQLLELNFLFFNASLTQDL